MGKYERGDRTSPRVLYASLWQVHRKAWKMWGGGPDSGLMSYG